jgi:hypothetical protein
MSTHIPLRNRPKKAEYPIDKKGYSEFEWEIRNSRDGDKTLLLGGRAVYSLHSPLKHAEDSALRLIKKTEEDGCDHIIMIGLGLGYLPRALYNSGFKKIIVWEPFPVMQGSFPVCDGEWRREITVVNEYNEFETAVAHFAKKGSRPKLIVHPGYNIFCRLEYRLACQTLEAIYNNCNMGSFIISTRTLESLVRLPFLGTVKEFKDAFRGKRAVLANPGPSLKQCIHVLKEINDTTIFASLQSAPYLQKNGVRVNFIVCADPKDMLPFTDECNDDFEAFFAETSVDPQSLDWKREKTFLYHFRCGQLHEMLWEQAQLPIIDDPVSSVSEVMLLLADYMGFSEIYCVGMDFCWKENRYTYRTKYKYDNDSRINDSMSNFQLLTNDDQIATTQSLYFHGARFMRYKAFELQKRGKRVYQAEGGVAFASDGMLTEDELKNRLRSGDCKRTAKVQKKGSAIKIEKVVRLLNDIKLGRIKSRQNNSDGGISWPFLDKMPQEELPEMCNKLLNKIKSQTAT